MSGAPQCALCGAHHWPGHAHVFGDALSVECDASVESVVTDDADVIADLSPVASDVEPVKRRGPGRPLGTYTVNTKRKAGGMRVARDDMLRKFAEHHKQNGTVDQSLVSTGPDVDVL